MARSIERSLPELRAWYLGSLRPKLADAARSGSVAPTAAATLDRQLRDLLRLTDSEDGGAA